MKKALFILLLCIVAVFGCTSAALALDVDASACILIDAVSGRVLYQSNAHDALPPASTTKVLTALITLEKVDNLDKEITIPDDFENVGESGINLKAGDKFTIRDMLYALMLQSANDAGQALAIAVSGSEEAFVQEMNSRTRDLGLTDSTWQNPHGLDAEHHLSSAYDLAMITREAFKYDEFNEIILTESYNLPTPGGEYESRELYAHNQFLGTYEGADGVKTGYTETAGNCLVASATRNGMRLIGVVLDCPQQSHYDQMTKLMDYGFENYAPLKLASAGDVVGKIKFTHGNFTKQDVVLKHDVIIAVPNTSSFKPTKGKLTIPSQLEAPFDCKKPVGTISYRDDMDNNMDIPVFVTDSVKRFVFADAIASVWQSLMDALFR